MEVEASVNLHLPFGLSQITFWRSTTRRSVCIIELTTSFRFLSSCLEDSYRKSVVVDDQTALLDILDTAGQEEFSSMLDQWMREGKGFLLVYNITSQTTFDEVSVLYDKILRSKEKDKVPIVLVGNKCDLEKDRKVPTASGKKLGMCV